MIRATLTHTSSTAAYLKSFHGAVQKGLDQGAAEVAGVLSLLEGTVTTKQLRRMNHPYGRLPSAKPRGVLPALPINKQSGGLIESMEIRRVRLAEGGYAREIGFTAPYAQYVLAPEGTKYMIARGFWEAAARLGWRPWENTLYIAMREAWKI